MFCRPVLTYVVMTPSWVSKMELSLMRCALFAKRALAAARCVLSLYVKLDNFRKYNSSHNGPGGASCGQLIYHLARGRTSSSRSRWPRTSVRSATDVIVAGLILVHGALQDQLRYIKCFRLHKLVSYLFLFQGRLILGWVAWD